MSKRAARRRKAPLDSVLRARVPSSLVEQVEQVAALEDRPSAQIVRRALELELRVGESRRTLDAIAEAS